MNTVNKICDQLSTMLRVAADWKLIPAPSKVKRLKPDLSATSRHAREGEIFSGEKCAITR